MANPTLLCCLRCQRVLASVHRGRLRIGATEAKIVGWAWLYCPEAGCGGWYVWRPKAPRGAYATIPVTAE